MREQVKCDGVLRGVLLIASWSGCTYGSKNWAGALVRGSLLAWAVVRMELDLLLGPHAGPGPMVVGLAGHGAWPWSDKPSLGSNA